MDQKYLLHPGCMYADQNSEIMQFKSSFMVKFIVKIDLC